MSEILINTTEQSRLPEIDFNNIPFGRIFADHMFEVDYQNGAWVNPTIKPYGNLSVSPALSCMHYGQAIFEGMKATKDKNGSIVLFRHKDNWKRLNASAHRMKMPEIPEALFNEALEKWLKIDYQWIPDVPGAALYIRPLMIATDDYLGVKASENYKFLIYGCPVTSYYSAPLKVRIEEKFDRASLGGIGEAKAAGNYAASMYPASLAQAEGFHQLLWTDAQTHQYIEELGTSNFFALIDDVLYTPETDGTILKGITRDSVIQVAKHMNINVQEIKFSTSFLLESYNNGSLQEAFATGTAATVAPIELIQFRNTKINIATDDNSLTQKIKLFLDGIKMGDHNSFSHWCKNISVNHHQVNL